MSVVVAPNVSVELPNVIVGFARLAFDIAAEPDRFEFITENLKINMNILESLKHFKDIKLINLGSSCIYPLNAENPISEDSFLTGKLEPTNSPYAIAKIAGIEIGRSLNLQYGNDVINLMPTNLYGPGDNYDLKNSHVIPALIRRFHDAKKKRSPHVIIWGTGKPKREFLHVNDLARACIHVMNVNKNLYCKNIGSMTTHVNVGSGKEITIKNL